MSDPNGGGGSFKSFLAFCITMFAAVLYLLSFVLSFWNISNNTITILSSVATVILICIVSVTGWRFIKTKSTPWKLTYILVLLAVVASVVVPVILQITAAE